MSTRQQFADNYNINYLLICNHDWLNTHFIMSKVYSYFAALGFIENFSTVCISNMQAMCVSLAYH